MVINTDNKGYYTHSAKFWFKKWRKFFENPFHAQIQSFVDEEADYTRRVAPTCRVEKLSNISTDRDSSVFNLGSRLSGDKSLHVIILQMFMQVTRLLFTTIHWKIQHLSQETFRSLQGLLSSRLVYFLSL